MNCYQISYFRLREWVFVAEYGNVSKFITTFNWSDATALTWIEYFTVYKSVCLYVAWAI